VLIFVTNYHALDTCSVEYFADFLRRCTSWLTGVHTAPTTPPDALGADALEVAAGYLIGRWKYIAVR
jgi:hypothetical protein